jgi:hypothetical protein
MAWVDEVLLVIAGVVHVASVVPLVVTLVRVSRWLMFHRRPELGTKTPDGIFSFAFGAAAAALAPSFVFLLIASDGPWLKLAFLLFVAAGMNALGWVALQMSFWVALAELRFTLARRRVLLARAERRFDPDAEEAARQAEQNYLASYWRQEAH